MNEYIKEFLETNSAVVTSIFMITSGIGEKTVYIFMSDKCEESSIKLLAKSGSAVDNSAEVVLIPYWHGVADELRKVVGERITV